GGGGNVEFELQKDNASSSSSITGETGTSKGGVAADGEAWNECPSLPSSKVTNQSFEDCLRAGEGKLREEIKRLHKELQQKTGEDMKRTKGAGALAAQARTIMTQDKTRTAAAALSTKGRASAVQ
ncbi:unnamed protein product, partial [Pylaiella littoralis]